jgi:hypothetical protein
VPSSTSAARFPHGLERACSVSVAGEPHEADSSGSAAAIGGARRREPTRAQPSRRGHTAAQIGERPLTETGEYAAPSGWVAVELWGDLVAGPQLIGRVGLGERLGDAHPGVRDVPGFRDGARPDRAACGCRSRDTVRRPDRLPVRPCSSPSDPVNHIASPFAACTLAGSPRWSTCAPTLPT